MTPYRSQHVQFHQGSRAILWDSTDDLHRDVRLIRLVEALDDFPESALAKQTHNFVCRQDTLELSVCKIGCKEQTPWRDFVFRLSNVIARGCIPCGPVLQASVLGKLNLTVVVQLDYLAKKLSQIA